MVSYQEQNSRFSGEVNSPELTSFYSVILLTMGILLIFFLAKSGVKKGQLATAAWGGKRQKEKAKRKALQQIFNLKRNSTALYVNAPAKVKVELIKRWAVAGIPVQPRFEWFQSTETLYFPDMQRGLLCIGAAGSGKTFTFLDPLIRSALDQGGINSLAPSVVVYDFKYPTQTARIVAYALKRGMTVKVFAPGFPESETVNLLDFLQDSEDATVAGQLATTLVRNTDVTQGKGNSNSFFEDAGTGLIQGVFQLAKAVGEIKGEEYADLMTAYSILSLPDLGKRLRAAKERKQFKVWTMASLDQLISVADVPQTEGGIISTAMKVFQKFMKKNYIPAFAGQSTLEVQMQGGELIIIGMDQNNRDMISGLLASLLDVLLFSNVTRTVRQTPLYCFLDELPTLYIPRLANLLAEYREAGFCGILAAQTLAQIKKTYGDEGAKIILANAGTKILLNPQEAESAEYLAKLLGETEIKLSSKSKSKGKGNHSTSTSEQWQKRHLFSPDEFMRLPPGKAVIISPAYERNGESYVPLKEKVKIASEEINEMHWSESRWGDICEYLRCDRRDLFDESYWSEQFVQRQRLVEEMFPEGKNSASHLSEYQPNESDFWEKMPPI